MDFEAFAARLVDALNLDPDGPVTADSGLFDELGVDSFQAFQLLIMIETWAGLLVPPPYLPEIFTLSDAYGYYQDARRFAADTALR
jgi:acyl carrier protein